MTCLLCLLLIAGALPGTIFVNPLRLFRKSSPAASMAGSQSAANMTWARASLSGSLQATNVFLRRNLWIWPIIAISVLASVAWLVGSAIETTMRETLRSGLQTLLSVEVAMLETWFQVQESNVQSAANSTEVRRITQQLLNRQEADEVVAAGGDSAGVPVDERLLHRDLGRILSPLISSHRYTGYILADKRLRFLSSSDASVIGLEGTGEFERFLTKALDGQSTVSTPFRSFSLLKSTSGRTESSVPVMYAVAPVRDENFQVIAVLGLQIRPEEEFTEILQLGRIGESGETYAFNRAGLMVSNSRFDADLKLLGLVTQEEGSSSLLTVQLVDPQGNLLEGYRPKILRRDMPLTYMVQAAVDGSASDNLDGYADYRGVPVVGAWQWLGSYELGVATEVDFAEAYRPLTILRRTFQAMFALLVLTSIAIFVFTIVVSRLQREARKAAVAAKQVGQYELLEKLGQGAMGVVYKGRHAMLRRPTAIKLLDVEKINPSSIARFEREVQITCQLNNPNTIAIYDYGRTPEGVFYYAMEYLDGINLENLVQVGGPLPESRVIHLLLQICGSLYEAHSKGLVHRDIKPANIMLSRRGGLPDVIKVLDFGLVKALDEKKQAGMTAANSLTGTPLYISPEGINAPALVDARSDLYAVGATAYFLLTGQPPFVSDNLVDLLRRHVMDPPAPPSQRLGRYVSPELETAVLGCLEKNPANRPQTARDVIALLRKCPEYGNWTVEDGDAWWGRYERGQLTVGGAGSATMAAKNAKGQDEEPAPVDRPPHSTPGVRGSDSLKSPPSGSSFDRTMIADSED
jgi:serine/threonine protein kinase